MATLKYCCPVELMLLVAETAAPVPTTALPTGTHPPELRFVVYSTW